MSEELVEPMTVENSDHSLSHKAHVIHNCVQCFVGIKIFTRDRTITFAFLDNFLPPPTYNIINTTYIVTIFLPNIILAFRIP